MASSDNIASIAEDNDPLHTQETTYSVVESNVIQGDEEPLALDDTQTMSATDRAADQEIERVGYGFLKTIPHSLTEPKYETPKWIFGAKRRERAKALRAARRAAEEGTSSQILGPVEDVVQGNITTAVAEEKKPDDTGIIAHVESKPQHPLTATLSDDMKAKERERRIAEHTRTPPKGRLEELHPVEVAEIREMKRTKKKFSLIKTLGKFINAAKEEPSARST